MKITVLAIGKLKERFWIDASDEYLKRLKSYAKIEIREIADVAPEYAGGIDAAKKKESTAVLSALNDDTYVILLDRLGSEPTSEEFSAHLDELVLDNKSDITFVIGGSYGVACALNERAQETISFGRITLPHNLARIVLLEQLYRAFKISHGEPYHK